MKKVKDVIKGHKSRADFDRLTIIQVDTLDPLYSGTLENFEKPNDLMLQWKKLIDNREVIKSVRNCGNQLFLFV